MDKHRVVSVFRHRAFSTLISRRESPLRNFFEMQASELGKYGVELQTRGDIYGKSEGEKFRIES
jgi:hypothetical protein